MRCSIFGGAILILHILDISGSVIQCGDPPAIQNGFRNALSTGIGENVTYNCNTGFGIRGSRSLTCRADGNWYPNVPTCENFAECGRSWPEERSGLGRVSGGSDSDKNAWPWQVLIAFSTSSMLESLEAESLLGGGSILNQKWVLSAAHVLYYEKYKADWPKNIIIFAGITKRPFSGQSVEESVVAYSIGNYHEHEEYIDGPYMNDIALIEVGYKLDRNLDEIKNEPAGFTFGYSIQPVCLPCKGTCSTKPLHSEDQPPLRRGTEVIVTGFGSTTAKKKGRYPTTLQQASLRIASSIKCREHIKQISRKVNYALNFTESMLCTQPSVRDACKADSGGPLVRKIEDENAGKAWWVQVGIVSFGYECASNHPGYYTKVESYIPWINKKTKGPLDLMILIPGYQHHRDTEKYAYKDWLKAFGNYVTSSRTCTLSIYQYGREFYQNGWHNLLDSKLLLNVSSSLQFQSRIDSLTLTQQRAYPSLYPETITSIKSTPWGRRNSTARNKILIILVERTIRRDHTNQLHDLVTCMEYEGISVYFIGVTLYGGSSTFETRLKAIISSLNAGRNIHMADRQQLVQERSMQSLTEYIEYRRNFCWPPSSEPRFDGYTCRWKSLMKITFHLGDQLFFECKESSPGRTRYVENPLYALCRTDGTWIFVKKNHCERE